ncbi:hypothetical protein CHH78_20050 [Shouchella clausii]|jgi:oxygen-independent coproporphyrinogen III oxidase|uniref:radical SAM family heme chaperone HemW n=1 Tax=Shouchella clausii TaxID=79880 RepID=UPI000BA7BA78|nr:radical SAM family heme chaperone HemW [Shouchella clausii]MBU8598434.1 radical SAM family heme chaperone HemW [Shouchella clausii]PAD07434.1 hypothetical protein CHH76_19820 [Shouchella clausii]PAE78621.1 hypothetical protein CHH78_20050 [Shouchella clausii]PAF03480.1 hypothetical protein CHH66_19795 [Shouchella clausii]
MKLFNEMINHELFPFRESEYIRWYPKSLREPNFELLFNGYSLNPSGIYIHIPFCDKICNFCPYNKRLTNQTLIYSYVEALLKEIKNYTFMIENSDIKFIYFGGGTPSSLKPSDIEKILININDNFKVNADVEVTLESHPSHLTIDFLKEVKKIGVTRISTGIQAFDDTLLKSLGSQHTSEQAFKAIENTSKVFGSVAIDLLFNCPTQNLNNWEKQLETATKLPDVDHLSCYSLILPSNEVQPSKFEEAEMTLLMDEYLSEKGFTHYASCASGGFDYSKDGYQCVYEKSHWSAPQAEFLGLGAGAMGFVGNTATVNGLNINKYIKILNDGYMPLVSTSYTNEEELLRRHFVLGVKTLKVDFNKINFSNNYIHEFFRKEFETLNDWGFINVDRSSLILTDLGRMYVDSVSAMFFSKKEREVAHPEEPEIREIERKVYNNYKGSIKATL